MARVTDEAAIVAEMEMPVARTTAEVEPGTASANASGEQSSSAGPHAAPPPPGSAAPAPGIASARLRFLAAIPEEGASEEEDAGPIDENRAAARLKRRRAVARRAEVFGLNIAYHDTKPMGDVAYRSYPSLRDLAAARRPRKSRDLRIRHGVR